MLYFKKLFVAAVFSLGLAACSSGPEPMVQGVQRIGVASVIGNQLSFHRVSLGGISKEKDRALIPDWGIDEYIEGEMTVRLQQNYEIYPMNVSRHVSEPTDVARMDFATRTTGPLDAYVIIVPAKNKLRINKKDGARYEGLGVLQKERSGKYETYAHVVAELVVLNGRTLEELRRVPLVERPQDMDGSVIEGAYMDGDTRMFIYRGKWPKKLSQLSNQQSQATADALAILLRRAINHSVVQVGLSR